MAFEQTEILNHDGIFGIDRADWEAVKEQFPVITENRWQKAFQQNPADSYCIYQLRRDPELAELRFMNSHYLREHGLEPAFDHYEAVYSGAVSYTHLDVYKRQDGKDRNGDDQRRQAESARRSQHRL